MIPSHFSIFCSDRCKEILDYSISKLLREAQGPTPTKEGIHLIRGLEYLVLVFMPLVG